MPNRTHVENDAIVLNVLRKAGEKGLCLDEIRKALFGPEENSNSLTKKILERLKTKGYIRSKMDRSGPYYVILPGR